MKNIHIYAMVQVVQRGWRARLTSKLAQNNRAFSAWMRASDSVITQHAKRGNVLGLQVLGFEPVADVHDLTCVNPDTAYNVEYKAC